MASDKEEERKDLGRFVSQTSVDDVNQKIKEILEQTVVGRKQKIQKLNDLREEQDENFDKIEENLREIGERQGTERMDLEARYQRERNDLEEKHKEEREPVERKLKTAVVK